MLNPHNWFAVQLKPNALSIAERNLTRQGFSIFSPKRYENHRKSGRFVTKTVPLFPGYVFVQFDPDSGSWSSLNHTRGVTRLVGDGRGKPVALPQEFMSQLISQCDQDGVFSESQSLKPGDEIHVLTGPFAKSMAQIESSDSQGRLAVLLEIMGQAVRTYLPRTSVAKNARSTGN